MASGAAAQEVESKGRQIEFFELKKTKIRAKILRILRKISKKLLLASSCPSVHPSVRMEKLGSQWGDF